MIFYLIFLSILYYYYEYYQLPLIQDTMQSCLHAWLLSWPVLLLARKWYQGLAILWQPQVVKQRVVDRKYPTTRNHLPPLL